jgi:L-ascorbate metabolism protein UlaG (beta-lactamase superfamily)
MILLLFCAGVALWVTARLGWLAAPRGWEEATGWTRIPADQQAAARTGIREGEAPWIGWLGHAGFVVHWHGVTLLLDPNLGTHCTVSRRVMERPAAGPAMGPVYALISHAHYDHLHEDTLRSWPGLAAVYVPAGSEVFLSRIDPAVTRIVPVERDGVYRVGALSITPVRARHNGNRFHPLRSRFAAVGYMITAPDGRTLYAAGDTAFDNGWAELKAAHRPDWAILPIGAYAPRIPLKHHHMNPEEAVAAAVALGVRGVIPGHFGTFTLSFDRPASALPRFARAAAGQGVAWSMPRLMDEAAWDEVRGLVAETVSGEGS